VEKPKLAQVFHSGILATCLRRDGIINVIILLSQIFRRLCYETVLKISDQLIFDEVTVCDRNLLTDFF